MTQLDLIATSPVGLEAVVARELKALGYEARIVQTGRILFQGDESAICRANLWLRTADRVLIRMGEFEAKDFGELFDGTHALEWDRWIPADGAFPVNGRSVKSQLSSVPACQKIAKKAVVERLKSVYGVEWFDETAGGYVIEVALLNDRATLTLDTTGAGLNKRGYRPIVGKAAIRETLAAGLILLTFWRPDRPLIDPFCGTGTIPIEAAMIGRNIAPGLQRTFAAEAWPALPAELWLAARQEATDLIKGDLPVRIIGTDTDAEALDVARYHADRAGVGDDIHFQQRPFAELSSKKDHGCVICNPPYGERMSDPAAAEEIYRTMPHVLRRLKTWSHYILTSWSDFEALVGRKADRRRKLFNARIECTYYQFHGPRPGREARQDVEADEVDSPAPRPAFGGLTAQARHQAEMFGNRLAKRARHLRKWPAKRGITCYRLYDRDIPEVPLVVDRYEDHLHISEYSRPHDRSPAEHADWLDLMARTAGKALDVAPSAIFLKHRQRQRGLSQYERQGRDERIAVVTEGGLKFQVNLSDYVDTGLFLDHRTTRAMVRDAAAGKRMVNLFGYSGAFTVYAADGGVQSTVTVDLSNTYLDWARANMALNGFTGGEHTFVREDAMSFLERHPRGAAYDLAVVDPPTFSNSKMAPTFWDVQRDHAEMLNRLLKLMTVGGVVFFSTNFRRFKLDEDEIRHAAVREISRQTVGEDFRNRRIHRCWRIVRTAE
jgi:23S rRNA (guanine2445-N2)-methyltransferase / 23S rRNA (guanine2069-N7)-methyltransferase